MSSIDDAPGPAAGETAAGLDLDADSREALELDALLDWLVERARTPPGRARLRTLTPQADARAVAAESEAVAEIWRHLEQHGAVVPPDLPDPAPAVAALRVQGRALDPRTLRDLARFVHAAGELAAGLRALAADAYPRLRAIGAAIADLRREAAPVLRSVDPNGTLLDDASPELREIRRAHRRVGQRLHELLLGLLRDPQAEPVVRDEFITQRNGRFVIPLRSDAPRPLRGIVHATSSSGATRFVEPLESVELNNELVTLAEREQQEIERVLLAWSDAFARRHDELVRAVDAVATVDALQARALFGKECDGVLARVEPGAALVFSGVRHPLLERRLREQGRRAVPLSLTLDPADAVLVLSGPNAGGKTVALKTFGLAVLMAQSGIPIPADEVRLPLYGQLRADIGDHQSIEADLSTFSAHVQAASAFLRAARAPALVLFDEIGSGTDPTEGGALARAILESLLRTGVTTVATTHQSALKAWAFTTEGAVSAAMEFDSERLRPTYRVQMGAAGVSAGLEIARRVGLDPEVVERARAALGEQGRRAEDYLLRLGERTAELERRTAELDRLRGELLEERRRLAGEAAERAREQIHRATAAVDRALADFGRQSRAVLGELRDQRDRRRAERAVGRVEGAARRERARLAEQLGGAEQTTGWVRPDRLAEGLEVLVVSLGRLGRVRGLRGERVEVLLGQTPFTVDRADLRIRPGAAPPPPEPAAPRASESVRVVRGEVASELKLIGRTVEEGLAELDKFLDDAVVAGLAEVRIVHGHGTGRLRKAVRRFLAEHVLVEAHRAGRSYEGGEGATVVTLRG